MPSSVLLLLFSTRALDYHWRWLLQIDSWSHKILSLQSACLQLCIQIHCSCKHRSASAANVHFAAATLLLPVQKQMQFCSDKIYFASCFCSYKIRSKCAAARTICGVNVSSLFFCSCIYLSRQKWGAVLLLQSWFCRHEIASRLCSFKNKVVAAKFALVAANMLQTCFCSDKILQQQITAANAIDSG